MPYRTRSARLAASLLSAVVAVLAFAVPSRAAAAATGPAVQSWVTAAAKTSGPATANSGGQQRPKAYGPQASSRHDTPRAVHTTVAHLHQAHVPHPPYPGGTGPSADRAPLRALGGPDAHPRTSTPSTRFTDAAPEPRGPPSRRS
ncbi:hypothetical protein [Streptomyces flavofungini]|uniref:Uncharacterized protein n=1 Tax=Streptomyces flavofungini TaxID=68200 RepID=A0ABS0XD73_9ACTN|nr:hypothetical protein [Streptomyces flavofungini]MBJ3811165.1 hypothetical protein [Streptomyces flavofungini]GHC67629.1 hypothetical protein GCM10010349_40740 [Streptomyces flavofungini]